MDNGNWCFHRSWAFRLFPHAWTASIFTSQVIFPAQGLGFVKVDYRISHGVTFSKTVYEAGKIQAVCKGPRISG